MEKLLGSGSKARLENKAPTQPAIGRIDLGLNLFSSCEAKAGAEMRLKLNVKKQLYSLRFRRFDLGLTKEITRLDLSFSLSKAPAGFALYNCYSQGYMKFLCTKATDTVILTLLLGGSLLRDEASLCQPGSQCWWQRHF